MLYALNNDFFHTILNSFVTMFLAFTLIVFSLVA